MSLSSAPSSHGSFLLPASPCLPLPLPAPPGPSQPLCRPCTRTPSPALPPQAAAEMQQLEGLVQGCGGMHSEPRHAAAIIDMRRDSGTRQSALPSAPPSVCLSTTTRWRTSTSVCLGCLCKSSNNSPCNKCNRHRTPPTIRPTHRRLCSRCGARAWCLACHSRALWWHTSAPVRVLVFCAVRRRSMAARTRRHDIQGQVK